MRHSRTIFALLLAVGCKGSDMNDPAVTTTVQVTSSPTQIAVNETAQAIAVVKDQNGNPLSGRTIAWSSLNPNIATVSQQGLIRGVAPGSATIQGLVDGITGSATVQVIATSAACASGAVNLDLAVGEVRALSSVATAGCIRIAATTGPSEYIVIGANTNPIPDNLAIYAVRSDVGENITSNAFLAPFRAAAVVALEGPEPSASLQAAFESRLRRLERGELDLRSAQRAYSERLTSPSPRYSLAAAVPAVGEKTQFRIPKSCSDFKTITATARHLSARAIIYTDDASPEGGFTDTDLAEIAKEFDDLIYPTDVEYFGTPLDLDTNSRIIILYTPEVNRLTPSGNPSGFVGGFFFAGDLFPTSQCAQSNTAEIFYLLTPDPSGTINGNARTKTSVRQGTRGTIAHEFVHMINASERIRHPVTTELEAIWLDEALAHFAEDLNGRVLRSLSETGNYTFDQLTTGGTQVNDFNAFFGQNFARMLRYVQNPGPNAPTSRLADSSLAVRGAAWSLLRYAADHYAPGGDIKAMLKAMVPGPDTGVVNFMSKLNGVPFDTLIAGWMVANYADDLGITGLPVRYTYRTYNMRSNVARVNNQGQTYAILVNDVTGNSFSMTNLQARSASGNYFRLSRTAGAPARTFRMTNTDLVTAASFSGATLIVLRSQ